jgi:hypothetical protein
MLGLGWLTLRQAREAFDHGRLEEAQRLLSRPESMGHNGASALLRGVAEAFVQRGEQRLRHKDAAAAWKDLAQAERIGAAGASAARLRQALTLQALGEARKLLDAGEPGRALAVIEPLNKGPAPEAEAQLLEEMAKGWTQARDYAIRGEIGRALELAERMRHLVTRPPPALERFRKELEHRRPMVTTLVVQLHEAWAQERWADVVRFAEQVLAVAPQHAEAQKARARAWKAIEPARAAGERAMDQDPKDRFLLWIDGAGGYLVCLSPKVTLGQAAPDAYVDVPLLADVSRTHAALTRDADGGYLLEAVRPVHVNDRPAEKALLQPEDRIRLGSSCHLRFRQPVPVSTSARLELTSGQRLPLALDGVLLMADTLVLGPGTQVHVTVPELQHTVVLFRYKDGLAVRYPGSMTVDGQPCQERGVLGPTSRVQGDDFAFAVEPFKRDTGRA